jgi:aspartate kinase
MSFGERLSAGILAALLPARGLPATAVDARDWLVTDDRFGGALVDLDASRDNLGGLAEQTRDRIAVHTGFLGATLDGRTTTLGRNGSDYTAALLANLLGAAEVQIWTDVPGVMTGDPTILRDAYPIAHMSYGEALELANFGARMFHPRTMVPLIDRKIPMRIRSTMNPDAGGTRIDERGADQPARPPSPRSRTSPSSTSAGVASAPRPASACASCGPSRTPRSPCGWPTRPPTARPSPSSSRAPTPSAPASPIDAELELERTRGEVDPAHGCTPPSPSSRSSRSA